MNPQQAEEKLFDYVADRLGPADREAVETILARDPTLARTAANIAFARDRLGRLDGLLTLDPAVLDTAPTPKAKPEPEKTSASEHTRRPPLHLVGAALLVVLVGAGAWFLLSDPKKTDESEETAAARVGTSPKKDTPRPEARPREPKPRPEKPEVEPEKPVRPSVVQPGVEMILPRLLRSPNQLQLERVWAALEKRPAGAATIRRRIPELDEEKDKIILILALAAANRDPEVRSLLSEQLKTASSPAVRRAAAGALGHLPGKDNVLVPAAQIGLSVRAGVLQEPEQRRLLLDAAGVERDPDVLGTLVRLLAPSREKDEQIGARLFELAGSKSPKLRRAAIDGLRSGKGSDSETLKTLIADTAIPASERALLVPAVGGESGDLPYLESLIEGGSEIELRVAATEALARVLYKGAADTAKRVFLGAQYPRKMRLAALASLASRNPVNAKNLAQQAMESDSDEVVRKAAKELVRALDPKPVKEAKEGE